LQKTAYFVSITSLSLTFKPISDMGLPGHRRTSSDKRRRAAHFALKNAIIAVDKKTGQTHRSHRAAPGATEYRGITIHVKGRERKIEKMLAKTKAHSHSHEHKEETPKA